MKRNKNKTNYSNNNFKTLQNNYSQIGDIVPVLKCRMESILNLQSGSYQVEMFVGLDDNSVCIAIDT